MDGGVTEFKNCGERAGASGGSGVSLGMVMGRGGVRLGVGSKGALVCAGGDVVADTAGSSRLSNTMKSFFGESALREPSALPVMAK